MRKRHAAHRALLSQSIFPYIIFSTTMHRRPKGRKAIARETVPDRTPPHPPCYGMPSAVPSVPLRKAGKRLAESGKVLSAKYASTSRRVLGQLPQSTPAGSAARIPPSGWFGRGHARWGPGINRRRAWQEGTVGTSPPDTFGVRGDIAWGAFIGRKAFLVLYNSTLPSTKARLCPAPSPGFTARACTCRWPTGRADG